MKYYGLLKAAEKAMVPYSSTLGWKIPWTEEPGGLQSMRSLRVRQTECLHFHFLLSCIGEGNGNSLQYSCLENPRDRGAWWAAIHGVTQSWTQLKQLSSSSSLEAEGTCKTVLLFPHSPVSEISTTLQHGRYHLNVEKTTVKAAFLW